MKLDNKHSSSKIEVAKFSIILITVFISLTAHMTHADEWELIWSDEFEGSGLPNPEKWSYEKGFVRNSEKQYYTELRSENARVKNGFLIIEARKEKVPNTEYLEGNSDWRKNQHTANYTSASLQTKGIAEWTYGRIEVRAKLPAGKGTWPAIWTLGANIDEVNWPRCGEIDIVEFLGKDPKSIHATAHFQKSGKHDSDSKKHPVRDATKEFHTFAIEWNADQLHFEYDGSRFQTFRVAKADAKDGNPFHKPHYLILNLALGGDWAGKIDDSIFPCRYLIDYVRVYKPMDSKPSEGG